MQRTRILLIVSTVLSLISPFPLQAADPPVEVTTCGQVVDGDGFLSADLDCSGSDGHAVTLKGGTLDLRGFTLTAIAPPEPETTPSVFCQKSCAVTSTSGVGTLHGSVYGDGNVAVSDLAIHFSSVSSTANVTILRTTIADTSAGAQALRKLTITDSTIETVQGVGGAFGAYGSKVTIQNSTLNNEGFVEGQYSTGVSGFDLVKISDSTISGWRHGVWAFDEFGKVKAKILNSAIVDNTSTGVVCHGGDAANLQIADSDVSRNGGHGIDARRLKISGTLVSDNGADGIRVLSNKSSIKAGTVVSGNALHGIEYPYFGPRFTIKGATSTGNGIDPSCGVTVPCADIASGYLPNVRDTVCGTSYDSTSGFPGLSWGVCTND